MKDLNKINQARWNELARRRVLCSRPFFDLGEEQARQRIDGLEHLGEVEGKKVLCLASGGGQQSVAFARLGGQVTVTDLSEQQLERDRQAASQNEVEIRIIHADMRDFSAFEAEEFDIVYQPYSINYVPDLAPVFDGIQKVLKPGGRYHLMFHNPVTHGSWTSGCWVEEWAPEDLWEGQAYPIRLPYEEGLPIHYRIQEWIFYDPSGKKVRAPAPQEFKHTLSSIFNGLIDRGLRILHFEELQLPEPGSEFAPGSWEHYRQYAAPFFGLWARK